MKQKTIQKAVYLEGQGLHFGLNTKLTIRPADPNTGIVFERVDLEGNPRIPALSDYVSDTSRSTALSVGNASICTVEHLLAATYSLGIDNVIFEINGPEVPILDGSAKYFIEAYQNAGIVEQDAELTVYDIKENICFSCPEKGIEICLYPDTSYKLKVLVDYNTDALANQYACLDDLSDFAKEISACRTFTFLSELEPLINAKLIKGGALENAIVIVDKEYSQEEYDRLAELLDRPKVGMQSSGILNNLKLQFPNEPARHKLLDIIGDLALCGYRFNGSVIARKPGHYANTEIAKLIRSHISSL